jgi:hypothetical protein
MIPPTVAQSACEKCQIAQKSSRLRLPPAEGCPVYRSSTAHYDRCSRERAAVAHPKCCTLNVAGSTGWDRAVTVRFRVCGEEFKSEFEILQALPNGVSPALGVVFG